MNETQMPASHYGLLTDLSAIPWRTPAPSSIVSVAHAPDLVRAPLDILRDVARRDPGAPALVDMHEALTFDDVLARAETIACMVQRALAPTQTVALLLPHSAAGIAALFGCLASGRTCHVIGAGDPAERQAACLATAGADMVVTESDLADMHRRMSAGALALEHDPDRPALVHFTSGSSGRPKGIATSTRSLLHRAYAFIASSALSRPDRLLSLPAVATGSGFCFCLAALCAGVPAVLVNLGRESVGALIARAARERASVLVANPRVMRAISVQRAARAAFGTVRFLRSGATGLSGDDLATIRRMLPDRCAISHTYASTEAMVAAEWVVPRPFDLERTGRGAGVPVGYFRPELEFALLDDTGHAVDDDAAGTLVIRSQYTAVGEWQDGRLSNGRLRPDPSRAGWRIFATGDLLSIGSDNLLRFNGRVDRLLKLNGVRVEPREIETVLLRDPRVREAVVISTGEFESVTMHAFVVASATDATALRPVLYAMLRRTLPRSHRPSAITILDALPSLPGGKVDIAALRTAAGGRAEDTMRADDR